MSNKNLFYNQSEGPPNYIHIQPEKISHVYQWPQMHMTVFCRHIFSARSMAKTTNLIYFFSYDQTLVQGRVHGPDHKLHTITFFYKERVQIGKGPLPHFHATWCTPVVGPVGDFYAKIKWVGATLSYAYRSRNQILSTIKQLGYLHRGSSIIVDLKSFEQLKLGSINWAYNYIDSCYDWDGRYSHFLAF